MSSSLRKSGASLSPAQLQAAEATEGPVMIVSCAGSGKTTVILERAARIAARTRQPSRILVVTFSRAAARELESRFLEDYRYGGIRFSTIHSLCYSVLAGYYGLKADAILKESEKRLFFKKLHQSFLKKGGSVPVLADFEAFYLEMTSWISKVLCGAQKCSQGKKTGNPKELQPLKENVFSLYEEYKRGLGKVDFDDMIWQCLRCFEDRELLSYWQGVFDYIMIDEYQDTSRMQAEIFELMARRHHNLCVVGDDDQSIYGFRGADSGVFFQFQKRFPECRKIFLTVNYRSEPEIVERAGRLIVHNRQRFLKEFRAARESAGGKGDAVSLLCCGSEEKQVEAVLRSIDSWQKEGRELKELAVLYRIKSTAAPLVNRLLLEKVPFCIRELPMDIHKGMVFQDILAYGRLAAGEKRSEDLYRILNRPKRYLKQQLVRNCPVERNALYQAVSAGAVSAYEYDRINEVVNQLFLDLRALKQCAPREFLGYLKVQMGYLESMEEYAQFTGVSYEEIERDYTALMLEAGRFQTMEAWQQWVSSQEKAALPSDENGVYLSTFHGAKGLEWSRVLILSADEKLTPLKRNGKIEDLEEERRLFYVAMTRAREELKILSCAKDTRDARLSRFVQEALERA